MTGPVEPGRVVTVDDDGSRHLLPAATGLLAHGGHPVRVVDVAALLEEEIDR